jgi:hypothetical protein
MPPPQFFVEVLGYGVLLPAAVAAVTLLLALGLGKRRSAAAERLGGALALAGGFAAGFAALEWEQVQRTDPWFWLPFLALLAVLADQVDLIPSVAIGVRWTLRALGAGLTAWLLVPAFLEATRPQWLMIVEAAVFLLWAVLDPLAVRQPGGLLPFLLGIVAVAGGVVLVDSSARFAQLMGLLAGTLGGCALISWWFPQQAFLRGMVPGVAVLLPGLLFLGYFYAEMSLVNCLLVVAAPLALWISVLLPSKMRAFWRMLIQSVAVLVPVGLAVLRTVLEEGAMP